MNPSFDDNLKELYDRLQEIRAKMETSHDKLSRYIGLEKKNIKLELSNQHGYCFRVTMKDEKVLRKKSGIFQPMFEQSKDEDDANYEECSDMEE